MAKRSRSKKPITQHFTKGEVVLTLATKFVYEIEIYKTLPGSYNLEDSKYLESGTYQKDSVEAFIKDNVRFRKHCTLVAAPESWLIKNNFKLKEQ